ncbi:DinB family protein [Arenibaculum sp.]|jgi:uncharacterized damage-inducible protein DinB|uniref:DinB family protein n=1 Tax=Arenibaculum sp. TaxID=2865862 RepID=UPI002E12792A|nr:DinB family protein [Arenibaculum sp.]
MTASAAMMRAFARNNAWSNHRLLEACGRLSADALAAPRTGFFPSIRLTLDHILGVDRFYLDALEGRRTAAAELPDFTALAEAQRVSDRRLIAFCDALDEAGIEAEVTLARADGRRSVERAGAVLMHLFVHQIHHRGQVHAMLSGTPVPPPQLDEFLLREDAARRAADLAALGWDHPDG